jgi:hypothetical protein
VDALDPGQLAQVRALAAGQRDPRPIDFFETEHIAAIHRDTSKSVNKKMITGGCI